MPDHRQKKLEKKKKKRSNVVHHGGSGHDQHPSEEELQLRMLEAAEGRPFGPCFVTRGWGDEGTRRLQCVIVTRQLSSELMLPIGFMVDLGSEGVKDAFPIVPTLLGDPLRAVIDKMTEWFPVGFEETTSVVATAVVLAGMKHAEKLGFPTSLKVAPMLSMLDDSDLVVEVEVPVGREGKPVYAPEINDDARPIIRKLALALGPDGFLVDLPEQE